MYLKNLLILFSLSLISISCEFGPDDGEECAPCNSNSDCNSGLSCMTFISGSGSWTACGENIGDTCIEY